MTTYQFQEQVAAFVSGNRLEAPVETRLLDLTSEIGELAKEILKGSAYGRWDFVPGAAWNDEMGDVFFSLVALANSTGVDLEQALGAALDKYAQRIAAHNDAGSAPPTNE